MDEHADAADVAFPAPEFLMKGGIADDALIDDSQQRQVVAQVDVRAPLANHLRIGHPMFEEHPFPLRDGEEELVEWLFILAAQGAQDAFQTAFEFDRFRKLLKREFK
jgi:hypothetical protein